MLAEESLDIQMRSKFERVSRVAEGREGDGQNSPLQAQVLLLLHLRSLIHFIQNLGFETINSTRPIPTI